MTVNSYVNGHLVEFDWDEGAWYYVDNGINACVPRACVKCGLMQTEDGHDACIANLPGVIHACCGHGIERGYVMFEDGRVIRGGFTVDEAVMRK